jgi:beta-glucosidase-like glycosyl hydrolase
MFLKPVLKFIFLTLTLTLPVLVFSQLNDQTKLAYANGWADSVYSSLTDSERIAQLIFIRANYSGEDYLAEVPELIKTYNLGGVTFFANDPLKQADATNQWNKLAKTPLFISIDGEWGLGMRLSNTVKYPLQMTLGAVADDQLIYQMGKQIGEQCQRIGVQINFAPVIDVNNNPLNPVIGMRSFGEDPGKVAEKGYFFMKGMQDENVLASAKHFPGHGDTKVDSHEDLPVLKKSKKELRETELVPFQYLIDNGVASVMVAHLSVPAYDKQPKRPASLSSSLIEKQLKQKMGFDGLVITDGLDMQGVTKYYKKGEIALEAFQAGNDILLIPDDIPASIQLMEEALEKGKLSRERLEESCKKILRYKYLSGAWKREPVETDNLLVDLNKTEYTDLQEKLFSKAITLVKNDNDLVPLSFPDTLKPAIIVIGEDKEIPFEEPFKQFIPFETFRLKHDASVNDRQKVLGELENFNLVIIAVVNTNISASRKFGISESDIQFIEHIGRQKPVVLNLFASPYTLGFFSSASIFQSILVSYQDKPFVQKYSAEVILGMQAASGQLPVSAGGFFTGQGISTKKTRLTYATPKELGIDSLMLKKIDSIALNGIEIGAFPGCQIVAAKDGYIFYDKSFGYHTYDKKQQVRNTDVYDLASLTKILATTPALMALADQGKIDLDGKLSDYLLYLKGTNKEMLGMREILTHQAGLEPWIPYYQNTLFENVWDTMVYRSVITEDFPIRVAKNMYIRENYQYRIYEEITLSEIGEKEYAYSDLGFYYFKQMIEQLTNQPFDQYLYTDFYEPMGLNLLRFKPRKHFSLSSIIPTENCLLEMCTTRVQQCLAE